MVKYPTTESTSALNPSLWIVSNEEVMQPTPMKWWGCKWLSPHIASPVSKPSTWCTFFPSFPSATQRKGCQFSTIYPSFSQFAGKRRLPELIQYAIGALDHVAPRLRQMGCRQLGAYLLTEPQSETQNNIATHLIAAIAVRSLTQ